MMYSNMYTQLKENIWDKMPFIPTKLRVASNFHDSLYWLLFDMYDFIDTTFDLRTEIDFYVSCIMGDYDNLFDN